MKHGFELAILAFGRRMWDRVERERREENRVIWRGALQAASRQWAILTFG